MKSVVPGGLYPPYTPIIIKNDQKAVVLREFAWKNIINFLESVKDNMTEDQKLVYNMFVIQTGVEPDGKNGV